MKQSVNGHHLLSHAEEVILSNIELKRLLTKRNSQTKFLYFVLISFGVLLTAVGLNKIFYPQRPPPITATDNFQMDDFYGVHPLQKISDVLQLQQTEYPHFIFLYKEMTIKLSQAFWDAALIKCDYVMHNYRLRWLAEWKPPGSDTIIGHLFKNTLYRAPFLGLIFETFNQGLRMVIDRTMLNKVSDSMLEFDIFSGKDFSERFVAHFLSLDIVKDRAKTVMDKRLKKKNGKVLKDKSKLTRNGDVEKVEVTDKEEELKLLKPHLIAMSEKWGNKFLRTVMNGVATEIWNGVITHYLGKRKSTAYAQDAAIHLLSILTYCHPELPSANFLMTGGSIVDGVKYVSKKYLSKIKKITEKNKELRIKFDKMMKEYEKEKGHKIPEKIKKIMTEYMNKRITEAKEEETNAEKKNEEWEKTKEDLGKMRDSVQEKVEHSKLFGKIKKDNKNKQDNDDNQDDSDGSWVR